MNFGHGLAHLYRILCLCLVAIHFNTENIKPLSMINWSSYNHYQPEEIPLRYYERNWQTFHTHILDFFKSIFPVHPFISNGLPSKYACFLLVFKYSIMFLVLDKSCFMIKHITRLQNFCHLYWYLNNLENQNNYNLGFLHSYFNPKNVSNGTIMSLCHSNWKNALITEFGVNLNCWQ